MNKVELVNNREAINKQVINIIEVLKNAVKKTVTWQSGRVCVCVCVCIFCVHVCDVCMHAAHTCILCVLYAYLCVCVWRQVAAALLGPL